MSRGAAILLCASCSKPLQRFSSTLERVAQSYESKKMRKSHGIFSSLFLSVSLVACGGGGGGGGTAILNAAIEGTWQGTAATGESLSALILENGQIYTLYGSNSGGLFVINGFLQGSATVRGNALSAPFTDYYNDTYTTGMMSATAITGTSISGTISVGTSSASTAFSLMPTSSASSTYNYNEKPNIDNVKGDWSGSLQNGSSATVSINAATGDLVGSNLGCNFTGKAAPRSSGKNVFDMSIMFGPSPCLYPGQSVNGVAVDYALNSGGKTRQLIALMQDSTKTHGYMFIAQR